MLNIIFWVMFILSILIMFFGEKANDEGHRINLGIFAVTAICLTIIKVWG